MTRRAGQEGSHGSRLPVPLDAIIPRRGDSVATDGASTEPIEVVNTLLDRTCAQVRTRNDYLDVLELLIADSKTSIYEQPGDPDIVERRLRHRRGRNRCGTIS